MKYCAKHILKGSIEEVLEIVQDRSRDPRVYPNISSLEQTVSRETEDEIFCEYCVCGDGDIPKPLRRLASPRVLSWVEVGCWDKKLNSYSYELRPYRFAHLIRARGVIRFTPMPGDAVLRELDAELRIDIPLLGELAARTIVMYQLDNYRREEKAFHTYLEEHRVSKNCKCRGGE
jgi:hypothetical protein